MYTEQYIMISAYSLHRVKKSPRCRGLMWVLPVQSFDVLEKRVSRVMVGRQVFMKVGECFEALLMKVVVPFKCEVAGRAREYPQRVKAYHVEVVNVLLEELRRDKNMLGKYRLRVAAA